MATEWFKNITVLSVLGALFFLRMMDLAVFDTDHRHLEKAHIRVHVEGIVHSHKDGENSEHETLDAMTAHIGFHTLLSVFINADTANTVPSADRSSTYEAHANSSVVTHYSRPPTPPPLA